MIPQSAFIDFLAIVSPRLWCQLGVLIKPFSAFLV